MPSVAAPGTDLAARAIDVIAGHLEHEILAVGYSGGKDSSTVLILTLMAALKVRARGGIPGPIFVLSGDTEIENPAVSSLRDKHLGQLAEWAGNQGLDVVIDVYRPQLNATWAVKVLSGSALPRYPNSRTSDCSVSWKVAPAEKALRSLMPSLVARLESECAGKPPGDPSREILARASAHPHPVAVLGSRRAESVARAGSMARHDQREDEISVDPDTGRRSLSPIAEWQEEDVWEVIALAGTAGEDYPVWMPDFGEVVELYRDAAGGTCVALGTDKKGKTACGARTGCWNCQALAEDKSLTAMLENPRYDYMVRLNGIRNYIAALQWDWSRRIWLARSVDATTGHLRAGPDTFDTPTLDLLTLAVLCADRAEAMRADGFRSAVERGVVPQDRFLVSLLGPAGGKLDVTRLDGEATRYLDRMTKPQFQTLTVRHLVALDFYRSLLSRGRPFHVLHLANKVWGEGYDFVLPELAPFPRTPAPPALWVDLPDMASEGGIGDPLAVALEEMMNGGCESDMVGDQFVPDHRLGSEFDVDEEAASLVFGLEWANGLSAVHADPEAMPTYACHYYLRMGVVQVSRGHRHALDRMIRRTNAMHRAGLLGLDRAGVEALAITGAEHAALATAA